MFTMKGCPYCDDLKKKLTENKISFTEKDVDEHEKIYEKFSKAVKSDFLPAIIIGKKAFIPDRSFKTIDQGAKIIKNYLLEHDHQGPHLD
jgi:glutaredoxin